MTEIRILMNEMASECQEYEFYKRYEVLAEEGRCDAAGGGEYTRVLREWLAVDRPYPIDTFIIARANIGPTGPSLEEWMTQQTPQRRRHTSSATTILEWSIEQTANAGK